MQIKRNAIDKAIIMEAELLCDFFTASDKRNRDLLREAEKRIYEALELDIFEEIDFRRIYSILMYRIEIQEQEIYDKEGIARKVYMKVCNFHTLGEFHEAFVKKIDCMEHLHQSIYSRAVSNTIYHIQNELDNENLSIQMLARYVHLTPNYLAAIFKKETGITIGQYCLKERIEKAKALLMNRQFKLNEIAHLIGYCDAGYFSKIFKREVGCSPSEYQRGKMSNL